MELKIRLPEELDMDSCDLTTLLANMWQNALEACKSIREELEVEPSDHRGREVCFIRTQIDYEKGRMMVRCENSTERTSLDEQGRFCSTKGEGRGYGLTNMKRVVESYGGYCAAERKGDIFIFAAMLDLRKTGEFEKGEEAAHKPVERQGEKRPA
jgi:sensor histidine kinase regulating citrate/malate metabolism